MQPLDADSHLEHRADLRQRTRRDAHHDRRIVAAKVQEDFVADGLDDLEARRNRAQPSRGEPAGNPYTPRRDAL